VNTSEHLSTNHGHEKEYSYQIFKKIFRHNNMKLEIQIVNGKKGKN